MIKDDDRSESRINPDRAEPNLALYHFIADRITERGTATGWQLARLSEESD